MKYQTKKKEREREKSIPSLNPDFSKKCLIHLIYSTFGFWYFGHFSCTIFFQVFFHLAHLALQNFNKDCVIVLYFRNFVDKSDQKLKTKNKMNVTKETGKKL